MPTGIAVALFLLTAGGTALALTFRPVSRRWGLTAGGLTLLFILLDLAQLFALPRLGLSYGPVARSLIPFIIVRLAILLTGLLFLRGLEKKIRWTRPLAISVIAFQSLILLIEFYGLYIEPFRLTVTETRLDAPAFLPDRALRILQLSDLHVERITPREERMLEEVAELQPDIIVLTGDYINQDYLRDPTALRDARQVLSQLNAPYGVYAISGNTDAGSVMTDLFTGLENVIVLDNEFRAVSLPGGVIYIVGISMNGDLDIDRLILTSLRGEYPQDAYSILLYHKPDLIETAAGLDIPLYFAGHSHGGQIRLPFYGALVTFSVYGKQYEMGQYQVGSTTLYVSRGLGMEGLDLPRVRFLCPPEIVLFNLGK